MNDALAVAAAMPEHVTLDDLAAMAGAGENHRYELSAEGVLQVMSPPSFEHQQITMRIAAWLIGSGFTPDQVVPVPGVHTGADNRTGGRQPNLTVWPPEFTPRRAFDSDYVEPNGMLAAIEIVSPSTRTRRTRSPSTRSTTASTRL